MNAEWEQWDVQEKTAQENKKRIEQEHRNITIIAEHARMKKALESIRGMEAWINDAAMTHSFQKHVYGTLDSLTE